MTEFQHRHEPWDMELARYWWRTRQAENKTDNDKLIAVSTGFSLCMIHESHQPSANELARYLWLSCAPRRLRTPKLTMTISTQGLYCKPTTPKAIREVLINYDFHTSGSPFDQQFDHPLIGKLISKFKCDIVIKRLFVDNNQWQPCLPSDMLGQDWTLVSCALFTMGCVSDVSIWVSSEQWAGRRQQ